MLGGSNTPHQDNDTTQVEWNQPTSVADITLPLANTIRVMKNAITSPSGTEVRISKDAQQYMTELATEFLLFISSEASDVLNGTMKPKHTLSGTDIIDAMIRLGFEDYCPSLKRHLEKFQVIDAQEEVPEQRKRFSSELDFLEVIPRPPPPH